MGRISLTGILASGFLMGHVVLFMPRANGGLQALSCMFFFVFRVHTSGGDRNGPKLGFLSCGCVSRMSILSVYVGCSTADGIDWQRVIVHSSHVGVCLVCHFWYRLVATPRKESFGSGSLSIPYIMLCVLFVTFSVRWLAK